MENKAGRKPSKQLFEDGTYDIEEFHKVFVECEDPTGYAAAQKLVGSWQEWERLRRDWPTFNSYIDLWVEEISVRLRSKAVQNLNKISQGESAQAASAAKWIAEAGWDRRAGKGRPSKAERDREAKKIARASAETEEQYKSMVEALQVIEGGKSE